MIRARLASGNAHKLEELRAALPGWSIQLLSAEYPPETGETYEENARAKAQFGRDLAARDEWVLGEDSGIEVLALGGRPGIHSARWADDPVGALLRELEGVEDRRARYVCALVAISPMGNEIAVCGTLEGTVAREPRGSEGFGYDPVFVPEGETRTVAELGNAWKRGNSHRARAAAALRKRIPDAGLTRRDPLVTLPFRWWHAIAGVTAGLAFFVATDFEVVGFAPIVALGVIVFLAAAERAVRRVRPGTRRKGGRSTIGSADER